VTGLLEKALRRVQALSNEEQDAIAAQILESLDDEETWERSFRNNPPGVIFG
jgi:DNA-binding MarR family transcriptional regulator